MFLPMPQNGSSIIIDFSTLMFASLSAFQVYYYYAPVSTLL